MELGGVEGDLSNIGATSQPSSELLCLLEAGVTLDSDSDRLALHPLPAGSRLADVDDSDVDHGCAY